MIYTRILFRLYTWILYMYIHMVYRCVYVRECVCTCVCACMASACTCVCVLCIHTDVCLSIYLILALCLAYNLRQIDR